MKNIVFIIAVCTFLIFGSDAYAEENAELKFGMSAAFSGPAQELGINMRQGIEAYFKRINDEGGIDGKKLELVSVDDGYEPDYAATNVYNLINKQGVQAFIGNVGTPTAKSATPITVENSVLYYAPFSGSSILRPYQDREFLIKTKNSGQYITNKYIINFRASYAQETEKIIDNLLNSGIKPYEIAIFAQDDSYGFDGYRGAVDALEKRGYHYTYKIPYGTYKRNSLDVENGLFEILGSKRHIRAVIIVGSYKPAARFIKFAQKLIPNAVFINVSFVGCLSLADLLDGDDGEVFVTQVVPHFNSTLPLIAQYREDMKKYFPDAKPDFVSLEGYIAADIFVEALKNSNGDYSSDGIIRGIEGINYDQLNLGFDLSLDEFDHQLSDNVWLTRISHNTCEEISWKEFRDQVEEMVSPGRRQ